MYNKQERTTAYTFGKPTAKASGVKMELYEAIMRKEVELKEVLPVLGEGVIRFLASLAHSLGYEKGEIVKVFGERLMTAEFKN